MSTGAAVPLWRQLQAVAIFLVAIREGGSGARAILEVESALRPGVQAIGFRVLRELGRAEALRRLLAKRAPPPLADALLCAALALAWRDADANEGSSPAYEAFTLVDQAVEAAKRHSAMRGQANFINACLRRFLRERAELVAASERDPVAVWNHPRWWIARLQQDHPQHWQDILRANNRAAPMVLRVNVRKQTVAACLQALSAAGIEARAIGEHGVVLHKPRPVHEIPGFAEGAVSVQDAGAQLAAELLLKGMPGGLPGQRPRILDACAAPGGKTAHLLELADAEVLALDIDPARCGRIHENLQRLGLAADVLAADASRPEAWWDGKPFDAILLDAPCTASGIVRRHPDVRWLRRESDIAGLAAQQEALLRALWPLLAPGGRLLYCTCSVFRDEGERRIEAFLAHNTDASLRPSPGHLLPQTEAKPGAVPDNPSGEHDGFFYALLEKGAPDRPVAPGS